MTNKFSYLLPSDVLKTVNQSQIHFGKKSVYINFFIIVIIIF